MLSPPFSVTEAVELGKFVLAAYDLFAANDPAGFVPPGGYQLRPLLAGGMVNTLRITGHSLGAALATLLAIDVAGNGVFTGPTVYTFAGPRVGNKVFAGTYDDLVPNSWRISNLNDIVPHLPPALAGYVHVDAEFPINSDDKSKHTVPCWHALNTYLNTLDAAVALDVSCVPS